MKQLLSIIKRELTSYFATPVAYVFITIFLILSGLFTFYLGNFFEIGQASLGSFFEWHPWLYLFLIPAITMRLWSEEKKSGTIELLSTLPITTFNIVLGKFLAAWAFTLLSLTLTFPVWLTVNYLGNPDNGVILASYIGSLLMAGGYLSIGIFISSLTKNQVIAFIVSVTVCFFFTVSGLPLVLDFFSNWTGEAITDVVASFSFLANFSDISKGIIDMRTIIYFASLIFLFLYLNVITLDNSRT
ncbi:MAG: ABC transporter permease [Pelagibacterales bacterium]|nr:ABC transporter permease [Pelagibacterales bacterium]OUU62712.1 MAG: ABC transporter permease [Alphaproteobacteria bacterium TMED62]|tara:strand:- start:13698 stop:14429 length:732 start_codon:yes stop_codon:yes gene_type:complete